MKHDLAKERPSRELLARLIDEQGLTTVLNTRSPAFKALELDADKLTKKEALDLMLEQPNLMKRPLVIGGRKAVFGFNAAEYDSLK